MYRLNQFRVRALLGVWLLLLMNGPMHSVASDAAEVSAAAPTASIPPNTDVVDLVTKAIDQTRGLSSYGAMSMKIKRPEWERQSSLLAWTRGREDALIRFTAPARDAGNALLKHGDRMWTFNPKLNRSIRLPNSMMSQSWAGSDFSYNDLSRSDKWLRHYDLALVSHTQDDGHWIYTIDAVPLDDAPVVWGKEEMVIRDDFVLLRLTYYDQDLVPVKQMRSLQIGELGGRVMATRLRMVDLEAEDRFTEITYDDMSFDIELEDSLFTVFALQSARGS